MRKPNGRMSKKDRRAIQAFGLTPQEDRDDVLWTRSFVSPSTMTFTWSNNWNGPPLTVGQNWYLSIDPGAVTVTVQ